MQATSLKAKIIKEINLIPEDKLEQFYQIVCLFRLGLERLKELTYQHLKKESADTQVDALAQIAKMAQPIGPKDLARNFVSLVPAQPFLSDDSLFQIIGLAETEQTDLSVQSLRLNRAQGTVRGDMTANQKTR